MFFEILPCLCLESEVCEALFSGEIWLATALLYHSLSACSLEIALFHRLQPGNFIGSNHFQFSLVGELVSILVVKYFYALW